MTQRNIHGIWTMYFENRILHTKVTGSFNREGTQAFFDEMQSLLFSSKKGDAVPWAMLNDARDWELAALDAWDAGNEGINWMNDHNCVLFSVVYSVKVHTAITKKGIDNQDILQYHYDYNEAYQACIDALAKAQCQ
ncbi:hypothetical protein L4C34_19380 [Vibrio profundum]|uniref:hypothetical protein n=1 Tax=Vibrio profundum TaxID=2910247 RepID=UPI003D113527